MNHKPGNSSLSGETPLLSHLKPATQGNPKVFQDQPRDMISRKYALDLARMDMPKTPHPQLTMWEYSRLDWPRTMVRFGKQIYDWTKQKEAALVP